VHQNPLHDTALHCFSAKPSGQPQVLMPQKLSASQAIGKSLELTRKSTLLKLVKILSGVSQRQVVGSNQSPVTNSDAAEHLVGGASYCQRRIAHSDFLIHPWFITSIRERGRHGKLEYVFASVWFSVNLHPPVLCRCSHMGKRENLQPELVGRESPTSFEVVVKLNIEPLTILTRIWNTSPPTC
jgi:sulfur carrier protein ThiS